MAEKEFWGGGGTQHALIWQVEVTPLRLRQQTKERPSAGYADMFLSVNHFIDPVSPSPLTKPGPVTRMTSPSWLVESGPECWRDQTFQSIDTSSAECGAAL